MKSSFFQPRFGWREFPRLMKMADSFPTGRRGGLLVAQTFTSFLAGYRLFAFLFPPPLPVNFQTFFGERIILCFLKETRSLEYCLTEQCWIKKGISCLRHEGFCIFNEIVLEKESKSGIISFQRMYHRCAWKLLLLKFCYIR